MGIPLSAAILRTDRETDGCALHHMINCAHPDHFAPVFEAAHDAPWLECLRGLVANASRCSRAELDAAKELDDGDPEELAGQMAALRRAHPRLVVLGGCCGTAMRHLSALARTLVGKAG